MYINAQSETKYWNRDWNCMKNGTSSTIFYYLLLSSTIFYYLLLSSTVCISFSWLLYCWCVWSTKFAGSVDITGRYWEHAQCKLTPRLDAPAKRCTKRCTKRCKKGNPLGIPLESEVISLGIPHWSPTDPHGLWIILCELACALMRPSQEIGPATNT